MYGFSGDSHDAPPSMKQRHIHTWYHSCGRILQFTSPWSGVRGGRLTEPNSEYTFPTATCGTRSKSFSKGTALNPISPSETCLSLRRRSTGGTHPWKYARGVGRVYANLFQQKRHKQGQKRLCSGHTDDP